MYQTRRLHLPLACLTLSLIALITARLTTPPLSTQEYATTSDGREASSWSPETELNSTDWMELEENNDTSSYENSTESSQPNTSTTPLWPDGREITPELFRDLLNLLNATISSQFEYSLKQLKSSSDDIHRQVQTTQRQAVLRLHTAHVLFMKTQNMLKKADTTLKSNRYQISQINRRLDRCETRLEKITDSLQLKLFTRKYQKVYKHKQEQQESLFYLINDEEMTSSSEKESGNASLLENVDNLIQTEYDKEEGNNMTSPLLTKNTDEGLLDTKSMKKTNEGKLVDVDDALKLEKLPRDCSDVTESDMDFPLTDEILKTIVVRPSRDQADCIVLCQFSDNFTTSWTIVQQRYDGSTDFFRKWNDYARGFGKPGIDEFWLGNDHLHHLTSQRNRPMTVRVDLWTTCGKYFWAEYNLFKVGTSQNNYPMNMSGYQGNASDVLSRGNGYPFSSEENPNEHPSGRNCNTFNWWGPCDLPSLNAPYTGGLWWRHIDLNRYFKLKSTRVALTPSTLSDESYNEDNGDLKVDNASLPMEDSTNKTEILDESSLSPEEKELVVGKNVAEDPGTKKKLGVPLSNKTIRKDFVDELKNNSPPINDTQKVNNSTG